MSLNYCCVDKYIPEAILYYKRIFLMATQSKSNVRTIVLLYIFRQL